MHVCATETFAAVVKTLCGFTASGRTLLRDRVHLLNGTAPRNDLVDRDEWKKLCSKYVKRMS